MPLTDGIRQEIRGIATKMGLGNTTAPIERLQQEEPAFYVLLRDGLAARAVNTPLNATELAQLTDHVLRERVLNQQYTEAARNACSALSSIAQITGSRSTMQFATTATSVISIFGSYQTMTTLIAANGGTFASALAASPLEMACPMIAIAGAAASLFGCFMDDGDNGMEIMLEQLQVISRQIQALHEEMVHQFGAVHDHLFEIHQTIRDGFVHLDSLIRNEVRGFRADAIGRLENIEASLNNTRRALAQGQQENFLQDLRKVRTKAEARLRREHISNEPDEVQKTATKLLNNWIVNQASSQSLNGSIWYQADMTADWVNKILCSTDPNHIQQLLGFLGKYAQNKLGFNPAEVNLEQLVHPGIFSTAVVPYLRLRQQFLNEDYIADVGGALLNSIMERGRNSLNFIRNVQRSNELYTNLFAKHVVAVANVNACLNGFLAGFNAELNRTIGVPAARAIDIASPLQTIIDRFAGNTLKNPVARHDTLGNIALTGNLYDGNAMPREVFCAEGLGLGEVGVKCNTTRNISTTSIRGQGAIHVDITTWVVNDHSNFQYHIKFIEQQGTQTFTNMVFTRSQSLPNNPTVEEIGGGALRWCRPKNFDIQMSDINVMTRQNLNPNTAVITTIRTHISNYILTKRKEFIARLLHSDCAEFNAALDELDASVNLIKSYAALASFPAEQQLALNTLCTKTAVEAQLQEFIRAATIETPLLQTPIEATINATRDQMLLLVVRAQNGEAVFATPLQQLLQRRVDETGLVRAAFLEHVIANQMRAQMPQPMPAPVPENYAVTLGIDLAQVLHDYNQITSSLVNAILADKVPQVTRFSANAEVRLSAAVSAHAYTPLHIAAYIGNKQVTTALTANIVNKVNAREIVNAEDADGNTALMLAAQRGHIQVVPHLCELGAELDHRNDANLTAQELARAAGYDELAQLIERMRVTRNAPGGGVPGAGLFEQHRAANDVPQAVPMAEVPQGANRTHVQHMP